MFQAAGGVADGGANIGADVILLDLAALDEGELEAAALVAATAAAVFVGELDMDCGDGFGETLKALDELLTNGFFQLAADGHIAASDTNLHGSPFPCQEKCCDCF
jgi:hypothetical protein